MILTHLLTIVLILGIIKGTTQRPCLSPCSPEDDLNTCLSGDWQCNVNEFCEIVIHDMISLNCKHTEPELQRCQERNASNSDTCVIPTLPSEHPCHYCCEDDQCVRNLSETVVSVTEEPIPAHHSCYSSSCLQGDSLNTCSSGQWACQDDEFCEIVIHDMISLNCKHTEPELQHCQEKSASDSDTCVIPTLPSEHACHYCCEDDQCVRNLSETVVSVTEDPIPAQHSCYSSSCLHGDSLNTCSSGQWACQDDEFCHFTVHDFVDMKCKGMNELQNCQTIYAKNHEACDPAVIPSAHACHYCCENDLCVQDMTSSNQGLLSSATTLITALPTTLPTFGGIQCVQCGDYDLNVPCTTMELLLDSTTDCTVPGQNFCMTDAATDSDGVTTYIKRCVNRDTCHTLWYLESSDQNVCRNFDESTPDVSCHFCCVEEGCNISILPAENTLYNGHR